MQPGYVLHKVGLGKVMEHVFVLTEVLAMVGGGGGGCYW